MLWQMWESTFQQTLHVRIANFTKKIQSSDVKSHFRMTYKRVVDMSIVQIYVPTEAWRIIKTNQEVKLPTNLSF